jgi:hypothetical protein
VRRNDGKKLRTALISAAVTGKIDVRVPVTPAKAGVQDCDDWIPPRFSPG